MRLDKPDSCAALAIAEREAKRAMNTDIALGVLSLVPLALMAVKADGMPWDALGKIGLFYIWPISFCYFFVIRKLENKNHRFALWLAGTGTFGASFVLFAMWFPPMVILAAPPVVTYLMTRMRGRHYRELELRIKLASLRDRSDASVG